MSSRMSIKTETSNQTIELDANGKRIWPAFWLEKNDGQWLLCRKSHPEDPEDEHVDCLDCEWAFEELCDDP